MVLGVVLSFRSARFQQIYESSVEDDSMNMSAKLGCNWAIDFWAECCKAYYSANDNDIGKHDEDDEDSNITNGLTLNKRK